MDAGQQILVGEPQFPGWMHLEASLADVGTNVPLVLFFGILPNGLLGRDLRTGRFGVLAEIRRGEVLGRRDKDSHVLEERWQEANSDHLSISDDYLGLEFGKYTIELAINFAAKRASHVSNVNGQASREGGGIQGLTARVRSDTGIQIYLVAS